MKKRTSSVLMAIALVAGAATFVSLGGPALDARWRDHVVASQSREDNAPRAILLTSQSREDNAPRSGAAA